MIKLMSFKKFTITEVRYKVIISFVGAANLWIMSLVNNISNNIIVMKAQMHIPHQKHMGFGVVHVDLEVVEHTEMYLFHSLCYLQNHLTSPLLAPLIMVYALIFFFFIQIYRLKSNTYKIEMIFFELCLCSVSRPIKRFIFS